MKYISSQFSAVLVVLLFVHCQAPNPAEVALNKRHKEIMTIHDEVMPKMKDIYELKKVLKKQTPSDENIKRLIENLVAADDAMMDWMAQYKKPKIQTPNHMDYLQAQQKSISEVRDQMLTAISKARDYIH